MLMWIRSGLLPCLYVDKQTRITEKYCVFVESPVPWDRSRNLS